MKLKELTNRFFERNFESAKTQYQDIRCLRAAVERFLSSGLKDDAFDVYFCFCEIFHVFGESSGDNTVALLNILSDHESNVGTLLDKQRDHYSHSAYVFALGLAVYESCENYRAICEKRYSGNEDFLHRWGLAALFHDIGYPFELAFDSIKHYTKTLFSEIIPLLTYTKIDNFIKVHTDTDLHVILARRISDMFLSSNDPRLSFENIFAELQSLMEKSEKFMDHAYFSAQIFLKKLFSSDASKDALSLYVDTAAAILLHNSFYKFKIGKGRPFCVSDDPIAYLLILSDELQIFDRLGYGRLSRSEPLPRNCYFDTEGGVFTVTYAFTDKAAEYANEKIPRGSYVKHKKADVQKTLQELLDFSEIGDIKIEAEISNSFHISASRTSDVLFSHIASIARAIHENYRAGGWHNALTEPWDELSLENKMSNILQAKSYADKLAMIGCFYDKRELPLYRLVNYETWDKNAGSTAILAKDTVEMLASAEHERWMKDKLSMGWTYEEYDASNTKIKEKKRSEKKHNCLVGFGELPEEEKNKDRQPVLDMFSVLASQGFHIYMAGRAREEKKFKYIGISGHLDLSKCDRDKLCQKFDDVLSKELNGLASNEEAVLLTACARGFDLMAAQQAMIKGIRIKAVLPLEGTDGYLSEVSSDSDSELLKKVLGYDKTERFMLPSLKESQYTDLTDYIVINSAVLIAGWDGKPSKQLGGTYYAINKAAQRGKRCLTVDVQR